MRFTDLRSSGDLTLTRPSASERELATVKQIIARVKDEGDQALVALTRQLDGADLGPIGIEVGAAEIESARTMVGGAIVDAMVEAADRIRTFSSEQVIRPWRGQIGDAVVGEGVHAFHRAGAYVPGGRASYPSSVLMCAVPARVAGVDEVCVCAPPRPDGTVDPVVLAACSVAEVDHVYRIGGAQAIAAMAFGTQTVQKTDVIVGPGNIYVALAKRELAGTVAIDSVAGPSEIAIVADEHASARLIASDLIAQAEHGPGGAFLVVTWSEDLIDRVRSEVERQLESLANAELRDAVDQTILVLVGDVDAAIACVEGFAPEHLELMFEGADERAWDIRHAGAVFVGPWSPVSVGDYLAGSNHVLPTGGSGRWASGLRASHFQRAFAVVVHNELSLDKVRGYVQAFASTEGLPNHAAAVEARFEGE